MIEQELQQSKLESNQLANEDDGNNRSYETVHMFESPSQKYELRCRCRPSSADYHTDY